MKEIIIDTNYPNYDYVEYSSWVNDLRQYGIFTCLENILEDIDCSKTNNKGQRYIHTSDFNYDRLVYQYIRFLFYIKNQIVYNDYCELLFIVHNKNIEFELANPEIKEKPANKRTKKAKVENKYIREETSDLFDGHTTYIYSNFKTGDVIYSDNPNLLEELNKPKEKKKKTKVVQGSFTFNFNKNK